MTASANQAHLHFVQSTEPLQGGGLGRAALDLHRAFLARGAASHLVTTVRDPSAGEAAAGENVQLFPRTGPDKAFFSPQLRRAAPQLVDAADIVHAHGFYVAPNWILGARARRTGRALVCHPHGFFEPWILARSRLRKRLVHLLFENANFAAARLWRALTPKEADQIRAQGIRAPIVVAANGVHLEEFAPDRPGVSTSSFARKERPRMLFLARLHPKKGLDVLIPAWAAAGAVRGDWELVIAGPDELNHRAEAETWVRQHRLENCVRFVGTVSGADKVALLRSADAFILPSHSEGFSVAILEAMACAVPVIATHACNFPELEAEGGGWLCHAETADVARTLAAVFAADPDELRSRGATARRLVEERYTWPIIAETVLDACRQHC